ncbi:helix-turn-helix domain containing protein [Aureimonas sp. SK2]|uniref:TetR/AcrR family transcriptional regulator n=1 Tax=Aureimonas sp. SK2 TaxID=3015992 RepID=UPI002444A4ED|nr:helix-turn-helix domain containing protein [Aureimonas sp. SK2]
MASPTRHQSKCDRETRLVADAPIERKGRADPALRAERKKRQIMDGARRVFLDRGYSEASMDEVAASAGVSKGTVYKHFGGKEALFEAVVIAEAEEIAGLLPQDLHGRAGVPTEVLESV